jgi:hypothetical protein
MSRPAVIALAVLLLAGTVMGSSGHAAAVPNPLAPELTVTINEPTTVQAHITEKTKDLVEFSGAVSVDKLPVERIIVDLAVSVDTGWASSVSPSTIVVSDTNAHPFDVVVVVPEATHADVEGHVRVTADARGGGFTDTDEARANVTVAPYYLVKLNSSAPHQEVLPEEVATFTVVVINPGNAVDSYGHEIVNVKELKEQGWTVELDQTTVTGLGPAVSADVIVTARPSQDWSWDIWIDRVNHIALKATSLGARDDSLVMSQPYSVYVHQNGYNTPLVNLITDITVALVVLLVVGLIMRRRRRNKRRKEEMGKGPDGPETGEPVNR